MGNNRRQNELIEELREPITIDLEASVAFSDLVMHLLVNAGPIDDEGGASDPTFGH